MAEDRTKGTAPLLDRVGKRMEMGQCVVTAVRDVPATDTDGHVVQDPDRAQKIARCPNVSGHTFPNATTSRPALRSSWRTEGKEGKCVEGNQGVSFGGGGGGGVCFCCCFHL